VKGYEKNISVDLYTGHYRSVHETMQQTVSYCVFRHGCTARRIFFSRVGQIRGSGASVPSEVHKRSPERSRGLPLEADECFENNA